MDCALPGEFFSLSMSEAEKNDENVMSVTANEIKQKGNFQSSQLTPNGSMPVRQYYNRRYLVRWQPLHIRHHHQNPVPIDVTF